MAGRQRRELFDTSVEEGTVGDQDRTHALLRKSCESRFKIAIGSGILNNGFQAELRAAACRSAIMSGVAGKGRVPENADRGAIVIVSAPTQPIKWQ